MNDFQNAKLVDGHCHIDLFKQPDLLLDEISKNQIATIAVTNAPSVFHFTKALPQKSPHVLPALGLHPELIATHGKEIELFMEMVGDTRFIGEIGLDYVTKDESNRELQRQVFIQIVEACAEFRNKVLTVHTRRSAKDVIDLIGPDFPGRVILHWFSGTMKELEKAIDFGFYFSVNGRMFHSDSGQRIVKRLPHEKTITESDAPFVEYGGTYSDSIRCTIENLAFAWDLGPSEVEELVADNFRNLVDEQNKGGRSQKRD